MKKYLIPESKFKKLLVIENKYKQMVNLVQYLDSFIEEDKDLIEKEMSEYSIIQE